MSQAKWDHFVKHDLPTSKDERWKYADLAVLSQKAWPLAKRTTAHDVAALIKARKIKESIQLVFINGYYEPSLSDTNALPANITITTPLTSPLVEETRPFAIMNGQLAENAFVLHVAENSTVEVPVHLLYIAVGTENFVAHPRRDIILGANAKMVLIEECIAQAEQAYVMNSVSTVLLDAGADLDHYKIQAESQQAMHIANITVQQQQDSRAAFTNFSVGSLFARDDIRVELLARGADCKTSGYYHLQQDKQYIDHHVDIIHRAPHTNSEMMYKGTMDKKSRAVFNGRLCVEKEAQKIIAFQANHNLLLSTQAEVYSKPELEISADDVKCKHGATTGQLNKDALFYMQARGISRADALLMLIEAFAEEIIQRVKHAGIEQRVRECVL